MGRSGEGVQPDVVSGGISFLPKADRTVGVEKLLEEGAAGKPEPHASIDAPISIQQQLLKHLHAFLPGYPEIPSGQEAGHRVTS